MNNETVGVGISTCNRKDFFLQCVNSIDLNKIDYLVVVNDGEPYPDVSLDQRIIFIQNESNIGVAKTKNKLLKKLQELKADHIFLIEDDCSIINNDVFERYINASKITGLKHFNFGPGSPWNRKQQPNLIGDLSKRHLASQETDPNPKLTIQYNNECSIALYEHIVAMFCYFHSSILDEVGLMDEDFLNAWEHVEHTYRIINAGWYTPFWWFADIVDSHLYIKEAANEKAKTTLAKNEEEFMLRVREGLKVFYKKHNTVPSQIPGTYSIEEIKLKLKQIYSRK